MISDAVRRFCALHHITGPLLLAASGGADSTALLLACAELRLDIRCAHVNHHLRGAESDADEQFLRDLCARLGVELHVADGTLDPLAVRDRGIEAAAREIRYRQLRAIAGERGIRWIATAHQRNDQAETVLMRLVTGSGIGGLRGIHPVRDDGFIRPLLEVTRAEIDDFVRERGIVPRFDASNDDPRFLRNRVRAMLRDLGTSAIANLAGIAEQARERWPAVERAIDEAERAHLDVMAAEAHFRSLPDEAWLRESLLHRHIHRLDPHARDVSATDLARLARELPELRRVSVTKTLELLRDNDAIVLRRTPTATPTAAFEVELVAGRSVHIDEIDSTLHVAPDSGRNVQRFQLPADGEPRFIVRNRRAGDRFHPLGLPHDKKLKDFLIDRKIAAGTRDRLPLLVWNGEIVWVGGVEISQRFRITPPGTADCRIYEVWMEGPGDDQPAVRR